MSGSWASTTRREHPAIGLVAALPHAIARGFPPPPWLSCPAAELQSEPATCVGLVERFARTYRPPQSARASPAVGTSSHWPKTVLTLNDDVYPPSSEKRKLTKRPKTLPMFIYRVGSPGTGPNWRTIDTQKHYPLRQPPAAIAYFPCRTAMFDSHDHLLGGTGVRQLSGPLASHSMATVATTYYPPLVTSVSAELSMASWIVSRK